jgi:hypothetical protein
MSWEDILKNDITLKQLESARLRIVDKISNLSIDEYKEVYVDVLDTINIAIEAVKNIDNAIKEAYSNIPQSGPSRDERWG